MEFKASKDASEMVPKLVALPHDPSDGKWSEKKLKLQHIQETGEFVKPFANYSSFRDNRFDWPELNKFLAARAIEIETLFPPGHCVLALEEGLRATNVLSQRQCLCLLAHAYFSSVGSNNNMKLQWFSLIGWLRSDSIEKMACFECYVKACASRIAADPYWTGTSVSFSRKSASFSESELLSCTTELLGITVSNDGAIEDTPDSLHADFANEFIGGGVLGSGCVQEEILFVIKPECLVSMLFCEEMAPTEAIMIRGAERFSSYKGYAWNFKFDGPYEDATPVDAEGYRHTYIVALDAVCYMGRAGESDTQYRRGKVVREAVKLFASLSPWNMPSDTLPFATGNWGCGAFGGDPQLKSILQWMLCSLCHRDIRYFSYGDHRVGSLGDIALGLRSAVDQETGRPITVGKLAELLFEYGDLKVERRDSTESVFDFLERKLILNKRILVTQPDVNSGLVSLRQRLDMGHFKKILETILKVLGNIRREPGVRQFRTLKKDNAFVASNFLENKEAIDILFSAGFEMKDSTIELDLLDLDRIGRVINVVQEALVEAEAE
jgi:hypothetical protein